MTNPSSNSPTALITGVSRSLGLGFAVARQLAEKNHQVILAARNESSAEELADELRREGHNAMALKLDLSDASSIQEAARHLARTITHLDVMVNNASSMPDFDIDSVLDVNMEALHTAFEVDVFGCWNLIQVLLPLLRNAPAARIVNVTSIAAQQFASPKNGQVFSPAHSLAKFTLNALTFNLARALADTPILVNAVDPGSVATHPERGDDNDDRSPAEAAKGVVWAAMLGAEGLTGGLFHDGQLSKYIPLRGGLDE